MKKLLFCLLCFIYIIGYESRIATEFQSDDDVNNLEDEEIDDYEEKEDTDEDNNSDENYNESNEEDNALKHMQDEIKAETQLLDFMQSRYEHVRRVNIQQDATEECDPCMYSFQPVGCYSDKGYIGNRPIPQLLDNHRTTEFDNTVIKWGDYKQSVRKLVCHCARKTFDKSYKVFGLQFYGECFSGENAQNTYKADGKVKTCIDGEFKRCNKTSGELCIGEGYTNFVYRLDPIPPPDVKYAKVGCFHDNVDNRALPHLLVNHRHKMSEMYKKFDWNNYRLTLIRLLHHCVSVAQKKGYTYVGLQYYGECWSGTEGEFSHNIHGPSESCVNPDHKKCDVKNDCNCIGKGHTNFVYKLLV